MHRTRGRSLGPALRASFRATLRVAPPARRGRVPVIGRPLGALSFRQLAGLVFIALGLGLSLGSRHLNSQFRKQDF